MKLNRKDEINKMLTLFGSFIKAIEHLIMIDCSFERLFLNYAIYRNKKLRLFLSEYTTLN